MEVMAKILHQLILGCMRVLLFMRVDHMQVMVEVKAAVAVPMAGPMDITLAEAPEDTQVWAVTEVVETLTEIQLPQVLVNILLAMVVEAAEVAFKVAI
jgi:hypothetical protein